MAYVGHVLTKSNGTIMPKRKTQYMG